MRKKDPENEKVQRAAILTAAWKLFWEKGYEKTTLQDILREIGGSKGRFYYYYKSKAELLGSLFELFDEKYEQTYRGFAPGMSGNEKMMRLQAAIFRFLEEEVGCELLTNLYLTQLEGKTEVDFWTTSRVYHDIMTEIVEQAVAENDVRADIPVSEIVDSVIVVERGQFFDWCLKRGAYSLRERGLKKVAVHLGGFHKKYEGFAGPAFLDGSKTQ